MQKNIVRLLAAAIVMSGTFCLLPVAFAQGTDTSREAEIEKRNAIEKELEKVAIIDRKVMISMSDGKRMAADIYRPKDESKKYGAIFVRTPYNFNYWDISLGAPRDMGSELNAVKRGYAYVEINERGQFFS
ncbi:MAG TPA: CocE/NonD family hydrolase, partial [Terriglobia bacterium]|nr:CocE/NonD family hydrolase [Terriglobia bacterium]